MSWLFKKRDPSKDLGEYYAQITNDDLDFDDPIVQGIRESLGGLTSWPDLSMSQLKKLTEGLQEQLAKSRGDVVQLGTVNYIAVDPDTGKAQETGLSWDNARILPSMKNFVIETVSQVFNDEDIRIDDDVTYEQIANALSQLIAAAESLGGFAADDLPKLPSLDEYTTAVETNQKLQIQPMKLVEMPTEVFEEPVQEYPQENSNEDKEDYEFGAFAGEEMDVADSSDEPLPGLLPTAPGAPVVPVAPVGTSDQDMEPTPEDDVSSLPSSGTAVTSEVKPKIVNTELALADKINQFQVVATGFKVDQSLADRVVTPEDDAYIDVMMAREKLIANDLLKNSASKQTSLIQKQLLQAIEDVKLDNEGLDELLSSDWQTPIKQKITQKHTQVFDERLKATQQNLTDAYAQDVDQENKRHEATLADLKRQYESDQNKAITQSEVQRDQLIQTEMTQAINQQTLYIEREVAELRRKTDEIIAHRLADSMAEKAKVSDEFMNAELQDFVAGLEVRRTELVAEHEEALEQRRSKDEAAALKLQAERENHDVAQLEASKQALETERTSLHAKIVELQGKAAKWQNQAEGNQAELERLMRRLSETTQSEQQTALIAALAGNNNSNKTNETPKSTNNSFIRGALMSAAVLFGIGGVGAGTYYVAHTTAKAEASVKATGASYRAAQVKLESRAKKAEKAQRDAQKALETSTSVVESPSDTSDSVAKGSSTTSNDTQDFQGLDADIANGSLKTYYLSFENRNLETEERTLGVGQLLVNMNNLTAAKQLAAANDGHNGQLLSLINQRETAK